MGSARSQAEELSRFKRRLAEVMVRSKLNLHDDLRVINVLWNKFQIEKLVSARELARVWRGFLGRPGGGPRRLNLYLNVPYCREKCSFCKFAVRVLSDEAQLDAYVEDTLAEIGHFAPLFDRPFGFVQVGGGTPSLLTAAQMTRLFGGLFGRFRTEPDLCSIEFHPASASPAKLSAARTAGFDRVSFGVQTLDPKLLERVNRGEQTRERVRQAVRWAREAGFPVVSLELILGLEGDSPSGFIKSLSSLLEERPTTVSINVLNLTQDYIKAEGLSPRDYFARRVAEIEEAASRVSALARERGYVPEGVLPERGLWLLCREDYRDEHRRLKASGSETTDTVLGLGQSAWSRVPGHAWYLRSTDSFSPDRPIYRLRAQSVETEMADHVRFRLIEDSFIDFGSFRQVFGEEFERRYRLELALLERLGKVRREGQGARFLPTDLTERFFFGSIFFLRQWAKLTAGRALLGPAYLRELERTFTRARRARTPGRLPAGPRPSAAR